MTGSMVPCAKVGSVSGGALRFVFMQAASFWKSAFKGHQGLGVGNQPADTDKL